MANIAAIEKAVMTADEKTLEQMAGNIAFEIYQQLSPEARSRLTKHLAPVKGVVSTKEAPRMVREGTQFPIIESMLTEYEFLEEGYIDDFRRIPGFVGIHKEKQPGEKGISIGGKSKLMLKIDFDGELYDAYFSDTRSVRRVLEFFEREGGLAGTHFDQRKLKEQFEKIVRDAAENIAF